MALNPPATVFFSTLVPYISQGQLLCYVILDHDDKKKLGFG
jgi:hypothetical protein